MRPLVARRLFRRDVRHLSRELSGESVYEPVQVRAKLPRRVLHVPRHPDPVPQVRQRSRRLLPRQQTLRGTFRRNPPNLNPRLSAFGAEKLGAHPSSAASTACKQNHVVELPIKEKIKINSPGRVFRSVPRSGRRGARRPVGCRRRRTRERRNEQPRRRCR